ncbi:MAG TPA: DUF1697 domain-containing protein [Vicinamibacterales bacterium]|nr:DUF1697 domain-containing protein [Vicinamibacterales bacterium]
MTYVALMRAINVAGHGRVTMTAVRDVFGAAGCRHVQTCIQSGNVIFDAQPRDLQAIMAKARHALRRLLGEEPRILIRTARDIARLLETAPFKTRREKARNVKLYVAFLSEKPRPTPTFPVVSAAEALEAIGMRELEVFIVSRPKASGFFGLPNNFVEAQLGVPATTRNWSTVKKIADAARRTSETPCLPKTGG